MEVGGEHSQVQPKVGKRGPDVEITKRGILGTLNGVEEYLKFTIETEERYADNWLPTLDTRRWTGATRCSLASTRNLPAPT